MNPVQSLITVPFSNRSSSVKMNSVQSLISVPFRNRSSTDRTEIKRLGRPTPNLNIRQSVYSKNRTFTRTFNPEIYNKHWWICGCNVRNALFCFPCLLFREEPLINVGWTDLNHLGERIKEHTVSAKHMKNVVQFLDIAARLDTTYRRNIQLHNKQVRHNRYILNIIINCVRFCGAFDLVLRGHDADFTTSSSSDPKVFRRFINFGAELDVALKEHFEKATVFKGKSEIIQNEILQAMFDVCQEEISKEIKEAEYLSVIVDETRDDASSKCQVAIVFRYMVRDKPVERFWDFLTPPDYHVKTLSSAILMELKKLLEVDKRKLIAQTYDGTAVMSGLSSNGVQAIVKQTYKHAAYVHCYAHQLNLIMLNAACANQNVRIFFANLQEICKFFSNNPQGSAMLDESLSCSVPTRWNFNSTVVCTVFEHRKVLIETLRKILNESESPSTTVINQASGYIRILTSKGFILWLDLFYKIMPHLDVLFAKFQTREIDPVIAEECILSFETQLTQIRNTITEFTDTDGPSSAKRLKPDGDGYTREAKIVCDIIICQVKDRFSFTGHLIAATLFFSEKYSHYSTCFPEKNFQKTIKVYPFLNGQKFRTELAVIYETEELRSISGLLPFYHWISQNDELSETLSETIKLLKILITTPMAPAEPERCFPTIKRIKTFLRNTVSHERLSALAMLSQERDLIESIPDFNQRVIEKFATSDHRVEDFVFSNRAE